MTENNPRLQLKTWKWAWLDEIITKTVIIKLLVLLSIVDDEQIVYVSGRLP